MAKIVAFGNLNNYALRSAEAYLFRIVGAAVSEKLVVFF